MTRSSRRHDDNGESRPGSGGTLDGSRERKGIRVTDDRTVHVERGPFEMVPHWILFHPELSALAVRLYLALRRHADAKGDCFPSRQKLSRLLGVSVPTLDRARQQLVSAGAIEMRQRRATDDRWLTSMYRVHWHPRNEMFHAPRNETFQACNETDALTKTHLSTKPKDQEIHLPAADPEGMPSPAPGSPLEPVTVQGEGQVAGTGGKPRRIAYSAIFEDFWRAYPRKVGKRAARDAFTEAVREVDPQVILAAAKRYAADPNREPQFTAHPTTWLRQGRWDDEPLPARSSGQTGGTRRMDSYADIHQRINRAKGITAS